MNERKIYYITNRNLFKNNKGDFVFGYRLPDDTYHMAGGRVPRSAEIRVGEILVKKTNPARYSIHKNKIYEDNEKEGSLLLFDNLRKEMIKNNNDAIIFFHGFSNTFDDSIKIGAQILDRIEENSNGQYNTPNMIVYSWPSDGDIIAYYDDKYDAELSCGSISRAIEKFYRFYSDLKNDKIDQCGQKLHIIAHSMGNYVLSCGINAYIRNNKPFKFFDEVILIAADEDFDAFEDNNKMNNLKPLFELAKRITIYYNEKDPLLKLVNNTRKNSRRLGMAGPRYPNLLTANVNVVDVTRSINRNEHRYHITEKDKKFKKDMINVLRGENSFKINNREYLPDKNTFILK